MFEEEDRLVVRTFTGGQWDQYSHTGILEEDEVAASEENPLEFVWVYFLSNRLTNRHFFLSFYDNICLLFSCLDGLLFSGWGRRSSTER